MDFLNDKVKPIYFKYLAAAFGSALISSIYSLVDTAMVGKYQGPDGTAALAVVAPIWNIIYSLGLLMGIGGSVIFSTIRGEGGQNARRSNEYFSAAFLGGAVLAVVTWLVLSFFDRELLTLFGAKDQLLPLARSYVLPIKFVVPMFLFTNLLSAFLRNDGNPALATKAVLIGGVFNVFGDYSCVFTLDMGIMGADALSVYGIIINISTIVQCCAYSVGQAAQPIISVNFGAEKGGRIRETLKYALGTTAFFGLFWTVLSLAVPNLYIHIFMTPTPAVLAIAPAIIRAYGLSFLLLPFNIFSTYYFQAVMRPAAAFIVSVARGALISGALILLLPAAAGPDFLWYAMPVTECVVAVYVSAAMAHCTRDLPDGAQQPAAGQPPDGELRL